MRAKLFILFVAAMLVAGLLQYRYDSYTDYVAEKKVFVSLPPGKTIKMLSFGYHEVVADMLFIWSIQFYSTYNFTNRYDYLEQIYNTITDISPKYKDPYIVGSWIMALEVGDIEMAIRLLQKGSKNMKDQWIFDYECGYYASRELKDWDRAEKFYKEASLRPGAPNLARRKYAHTIYMKDNLDAAYKMWFDIYKKAEDRIEQDAAFNHLFQIKFEKDRLLLTEKLNQYKNQYGRFPGDLNQLVRAGLLNEIPVDFSGTPYIYKPGTSAITARKVFKWKK